MAAVPKKRPSHTRKHHQHTAWQNEWNLPTLQPCPECGALKVPHRICTECGMYKGRQVMEAKTVVKRVNK